jgi:hypothetical protein
MSQTSLRVTWVASQTGTTVSGSATLVKPATNIPATGTLTGTLTGSQLSLTYLVPAGSVPGFPGCTVSGTGLASATSSTISGMLSITFGGCAGSGLQPTGNDQLVMTKD